MIDKNKVVIIGNAHGWYSKAIRESGYKLVEMYRGKKTLLRAIREVFFRFNLPAKSIFFNKEAIMSNKIIITDDSATYNYMEWLHKKCQSCMIAIRYENPINPKYPPDGFNDSWCQKWTLDKEDAMKYNMHYLESGGYFRQWTIEKNDIEYDVFYVGKDKGRLEKLRQIENALQNEGLKTMFYITWERGWQKKEDGIHKPFIPYERILDYIGKSHAILHLIDGAANGITIRIQESLIHKKKLITDDESISQYDFYNPNNTG